MSCTVSSALGVSHDKDKMCMAPALMEVTSYVGNSLKPRSKMHTYVLPMGSVLNEKVFGKHFIFLSSLNLSVAIVIIYVCG